LEHVGFLGEEPLKIVLIESVQLDIDFVSKLLLAPLKDLEK
jgi:hypothetical protein